MSKLLRSLRLREYGTNWFLLRASTTFLAKLRRSSGSTGSGNQPRKERWIHSHGADQTTLEKSSGQSAGGARRLFLLKEWYPH